MSGRKGKVDLDTTRSQLEQAGLAHAAARLAELVEEAAKQQLSVHRFLDRVLAAELVHLCVAPHKWTNVECRVMWSWSPKTS